MNGNTVAVLLGSVVVLALAGTAAYVMTRPKQAGAAVTAAGDAMQRAGDTVQAVVGGGVSRPTLAWGGSMRRPAGSGGGKSGGNGLVNQAGKALGSAAGKALADGAKNLLSGLFK